MASPERERVDAAAADAAQRLRGKVMCGLSCKAERRWEKWCPNLENILHMADLEYCKTADSKENCCENTGVTWIVSIRRFKSRCQSLSNILLHQERWGDKLGTRSFKYYQILIFQMILMNSLGKIPCFNTHMVWSGMKPHSFLTWIWGSSCWLGDMFLFFISEWAVASLKCRV